MLVQGDIVISRPIDEVFDFVADERNEPKYNPQMTLAEMVTQGPIGVGSKFPPRRRSGCRDIDCGH